LRNPKKKNPNLTKLFSCKNFRILKKDNGGGFEVSISKKYFKLAVDRNKIKRRVKEIIRKNGYSDFLSNGFVFSVFSLLQSYHMMKHEVKIVMRLGC